MVHGPHLAHRRPRRRLRPVGCRGCSRCGCFILSFVFESASSSVPFTLVTATAGGAVPVWLQLTVAPSRPSTSRQEFMATRAYLLHGEQHTDAQGVSSSQRSYARMPASSRDTGICDMPSCSAICDCVFSSKHRSAKMVCSRSGSARINGRKAFRSTKSARCRSSTPIVSWMVSPSLSPPGGRKASNDVAE
jgi:hypothetical protein